MGDGDLLAVEQDDADVLDGDVGGALGLVADLFDAGYELPVFHGEIGRIGKTEGSLDHGYPILMMLPRRSICTGMQ